MVAQLCIVKCDDCNKEYKRKFEAAKSKLQNQFKILTENDINRINIDELYDLYNNGFIIFDKRYEQKFIDYVKEK